MDDLGDTPLLGAAGPMSDRGGSRGRTAQAREMCFACACERDRGKCPGPWSRRRRAVGAATSRRDRAGAAAERCGGGSHAGGRDQRRGACDADGRRRPVGVADHLRDAGRWRPGALPLDWPSTAGTSPPTPAPAWLSPKSIARQILSQPRASPWPAASNAHPTRLPRRGPRRAPHGCPGGEHLHRLLRLLTLDPAHRPPPLGRRIRPHGLRIGAGLRRRTT